MSSSLAMAKVLSCIFLTSQMAVTAERLASVGNVLQAVGSGTAAGGPICELTWIPKPDAAACTAEFEVRNCVVGCKPTDTDRSHNKMYPTGFLTETITVGTKQIQWCQCSTLQGDNLLQVPGECGSKEQGQEKCWLHYRYMTTEEYESENGMETKRTIPHKERYDEVAFTYFCNDKRTCQEDEDCTLIKLPTLWDSRNEKEKKMLGNLVKKRATGAPLTRTEKDLLRKFGKEDMRKAGMLAAEEESQPEVVTQIQAFTNKIGETDDILEDTPGNTPAPVGLFNELAAKGKKGDGTFTVQELKDHYEDLLDGTYISVDHLATVAGLTDPEHVVTLEEYVKFLEPDC